MTPPELAWGEGPGGLSSGAVDGQPVSSTSPRADRGPVQSVGLLNPPRTDGEPGTNGLGSQSGDWAHASRRLSSRTKASELAP
jgi:hypothetical protein